MMTIAARLKPLVDILNRFSAWLLLLAVGWLCWTLARLLWLLLAPPTAPALPLVPIQSMTAAMDNSPLFAIFADAAPPTQAANPPPNFILKGVLLAIPESLSSALLDINGEVKNYRIGDSLQDSGYTLIGVDWNAIIVADASDNQTVVRMADAMPLDQSDQPVGAVSNQRLPDNNMLPGAPPMMQGAPVASDNGTNNGIEAAPVTTNNGNPNTAISEAVTGLQENPANYLSSMGLTASGEGYQVTAATPAGVRSRLGLETGDRVLSVNGQKVGGNAAQDASILQQVQQAGEAQIQVQRGDQMITIRQQF